MNITPTAMVQEVRRIAQENPDFNYLSEYASCEYVDSATGEELTKDTPREDVEGRCILGRAYMNLGGDFRKLLPVNNDIFESISDIFFDGSSVDEDVVSWLSHVQVGQDMAGTWSEAVRYADLR